MPFRDAATSIAAAWRSIAAQTLPDWELLAIDDHSGDDGAAALRTAAGGDPRLRILRPDRPGLVAALHAGCAAARAPLLARMDADDQMRPERLERQATLLAEDPSLGVASCLVEFGGDPIAAAGYAEHVRWVNGLVTPEQIHLARFVDAPLPHPTALLRRTLLDRHGGYREGPFPEDHELWLRLLAAGVRIAKVPQTLLRWNDPPTRLSRHDPRYGVDAVARLRCDHLAQALRGCDERRPLWLWGSGRITRRRFDHLARAGLPFEGFIDIAPQRIGRRIGGRPVIGPDELPPIERSFILSGVGVRGARSGIRAALLASGRTEGRDFLLAS